MSGKTKVEPTLQSESSEELTTKEVVSKVSEKLNKVFPNTALSIYRKSGKVFMVEIGYNPDTQEVGLLNSSLIDDGLEMARETFKIKAATLFWNFND